MLAGAAVMSRFGIGGTPLVALPDLVSRGEVWLKAEYRNPFGSVKDRTAAFLLAWALREAGPRVRVVESTSGNLGLALAQLGQRLDVVVTLVLDASIPEERITEVKATGAQVRVARQCREGLNFRETRIAIAREMGEQPGWLWLNQYGNEVGLLAHAQTTGPEIWHDRAGAVDVVVASVGTGGTVCGLGAALHDMPTPPTVVGVEPAGSTISGGTEGDYLPAGAGMRGSPEIVSRHRKLIDVFGKVPDPVSARWAATLRRRHGLAVGLTTGAAVAVAALLAERDGCRTVAVAPDHGTGFQDAIEDLAADADEVPDRELVQLVPFGTVSEPLASVHEVDRQ